MTEGTKQPEPGQQPVLVQGAYGREYHAIPAPPMRRTPPSPEMLCEGCKQVRPWARWEAKTQRALCARCVGAGHRLQEQEG